MANIWPVGQNWPLQGFNLACQQLVLSCFLLWGCYCDITGCFCPVPSVTLSCLASLPSIGWGLFPLLFPSWHAWKCKHPWFLAPPPPFSIQMWWSLWKWQWHSLFTQGILVQAHGMDAEGLSACQMWGKSLWIMVSCQLLFRAGSMSYSWAPSTHTFRRESIAA